ncbi:MAG: hypothetical protein JST92_00390 [Deltaproteobacteria bacterium]|nr:hypothetical protein [Deltaproteobacteria bacterium]
MKRILAAFVAALALSAASAARADGAAPAPAGAAAGAPEKKFLIGGEASLGLPIGDWANANSIGIGLYVNGEYLFQPQITFTGRLGFNYHLSNNDLHSTVIPVMVGGRYYFTAATPHQGLFGFAELGFNDIMVTASYNGFSASSSAIYLGLGAGAGYQMGPWTFKVGINAADIGSFGSSLEISAHASYQFYAF